MEDETLFMEARVFDEQSNDKPTESSVSGKMTEPEQVAGELYDSLK